MAFFFAFCSRDYGSRSPMICHVFFPAAEAR
jgi:hypothetical protein